MPQPPAKVRTLAQPLEYVGYWRIAPMTIDATNTTTMNPAAIGIGAAVSRSTEAGVPAPDTCSQKAHSAATANSAKKIVLMVTPPIAGTELIEQHTAVRRRTTSR